MFKKIALCAALTALASTAFAATPAFYVGADVGTTKLNDLSDRKTSFGGYVGYQFTETLAVEGGFRRLADFDYYYGTTKVGVTADQTALSVIGTLPVGGGFGLFGRLGYNHLTATGKVGSVSASDSTNGGLYGLGMNYVFTPAVSARVELQKPSSDTTNLSFGVSLKF
jgi:hypothetical protein